jgi:hypothetical protein
MKRSIFAFVLLLLSSTAYSQEYKDAHRLGGSTSFTKAKLTSVASINKFASTPSVKADIGVVLEASGLAEFRDEIIVNLRGQALDHTYVQPGTTIEWMAYRPKGKVGRLLKLRWAGKKPFEAYAFRITRNGRIYAFVLPVDCGNLALLSVKDVPRIIITPSPEPPPAPTPEPPAVVVPPAPEPKPPVIVPPVITPAPKVKASPFFLDVMGGKDRRTRRADGLKNVAGLFVRPNSDGVNYTQCSPLLDIKFGAAKKFDNLWEVAGAGGVAISLVQDEAKVRQHEVFADFEVNKYTSKDGGFIGSGITFWDVTSRDNWTPGVLVHGGVPVGKHTYVVAEGRVFFNQMGDISNNYQVWAGLRIH